MNKTLTKALTALRFPAYILIVGGILMSILVAGWEVSDEQQRLTTYVTIVMVALASNIVDGYTWLVKRFSSEQE